MSPRILSESLNSLNKVNFLTGFQVKHICHVFEDLTFHKAILALCSLRRLSFPGGVSLCTPKATSLDEGLVKYMPVCIDKHDIALCACSSLERMVHVLMVCVVVHAFKLGQCIVFMTISSSLELL